MTEIWGYEIEAPRPPSVNAVWRRARNGGVFRDKRADVFATTVAVLCHEAGVERIRRPARVAVEMLVGQSSGAVMDIDNAWKVTLDALTKAGAWDDDSQIAVLTAREDVDERSSRPTIKVRWRLA